MKLSLVFPVYKKEDVVSKQVLRLYRYLEKMGISFEFILVIDGIIDDTKLMLEMFIIVKELKNVRVVSYRDNRGKGYAVRYGMKYATGDIVGFTDADTDILPESLGTALRAIEKDGIDMVAPSKLHFKSNAKLNFKRKVFSAGLRTINRIFLKQPKNVKDIAGGLKLFTREAAKQIFPNLKVDRFAMDSEIFYFVEKNKLKVAITPIYLNRQSKSTSANIKQILIMLKDIIGLSLEIRFAELSKIKNIALKPFRM
ncbi:MAG: glycosyltransferase [bacterium]